jgi:TRAP-type C4-dicarboxylate transport system permease small subunit
MMRATRTTSVQAAQAWQTQAKSLVRRLSVWLNSLSYVALAGLMLLVTVNVILRAVFKSPILGTYDLSGFLTVVAIGCGLALCSLDNGHIEIGLFVDKTRGQTHRWITATGRTLTSAILAVYTYAMFDYAARLQKAGEVSVTTKTPLHLFVYLLAACFLVFTLAALVRIFENEPGGAQK